MLSKKQGSWWGAVGRRGEEVGIEEKEKVEEEEGEEGDAALYALAC